MAVHSQIDFCRDLRHMMVHNRGDTSDEVEAPDRMGYSQELEASVRTGFCRDSWRVEALAQMQFARDLGDVEGFDETATRRKLSAPRTDVVGFGRLPLSLRYLAAASN